MLGYSENEMIGKNLSYFINESNTAQIQSLMASKKDTRGHFEFEFRQKGGSSIFASIAASTLKDDEGNKIGYLALVADVTEQVKMKQKLEKYSENLEGLVARGHHSWKKLRGWPPLENWPEWWGTTYVIH